MRKKTNDMIHNSQNAYYQYNKIVWFNGKQSKKKKRKKVTHFLLVKLVNLFLKVNIHVDKNVLNIAFSSRTIWHLYEVV